jgi:hypothetical protein
MSPATPGIHHVTALVGDSDENAQFDSPPVGGD